MRTSEAGSKTARRPRRMQGFTLLELLVVVAIIAVATAGVSLALRDSGQNQLEREAQRLAALLESARAQSRTLGVPVRWLAGPDGFRFEGLPSGSLPERWLDSTTMVRGTRVLQLGPEPMLPPQGITLFRADHPAQSLRVATDGLRPFSTAPEAQP